MKNYKVVATLMFILILIMASTVGLRPSWADPGSVDNCSYDSGNESVCAVSMYALIANPKLYYGKQLRVIGYLAIDYGALKLWPNVVSFAHDIDADSVVIDMPYDKKVELSHGNNRTYCVVVAVFNKADNKKLGLHSTDSILTNVKVLRSVGKRGHSRFDWVIGKDIGEMQSPADVGEKYDTER